ncbi:MAG TPA: hypothetical protein VFQ76_00960 [Longimicrobiaceae bacterium]|nr:hypothetical protein [Longimicrobiaceae bacterium]
MRPLLAPLALLPLLTACADLLPPGDCTTDVKPAVSVLIRDARSGGDLTGPATAIARDGAFADTAEIGAGDSWAWLALERPGVYEVTVRRAGYREWTRTGVRARDGECHVRTATLRAELEPAT